MVPKFGAPSDHRIPQDALAMAPMAPSPEAEHSLRATRDHGGGWVHGHGIHVLSRCLPRSSTILARRTADSGHWGFPDLHEEKNDPNNIYIYCGTAGSKCEQANASKAVLGQQTSHAFSIIQADGGSRPM